MTERSARPLDLVGLRALVALADGVADLVALDEVDVVLERGGMDEEVGAAALGRDEAEAAVGVVAGHDALAALAGARSVVLAGVEQTPGGEFALTYPRRLGFGLGSSVVSLSWRTGDDIVVSRNDPAHPVSYVNLDGVNSDAPDHGLTIPVFAIAANPSAVYVGGPQGVLLYSASAS